MTAIAAVITVLRWIEAGLQPLTEEFSTKLMKIRIATAQYAIGSLQSWSEYEAKISLWVERAVAQGAQFLVFPEYFSMELTSLFCQTGQKSLTRQWAALQESFPNFLALFRQLARAHQIYILAGTFLVRVAEGFHNRAHLLGPTGTMVFQDKLQLPPFETEQILIQPSNEIKVFDTRFGKIGVNICYDIEFPLIARQQIAAGAKLLLVPSYTGSLAGYHRVRIGCQARALEGQCYVVQATTITPADASPKLNVPTGAAAVYAPPDRGFPDDGVLAIGKINEPQWVYTELDLAAIDQVRQHGEALNYQDWNGQNRLEKIKLEQTRILMGSDRT
jgi:predicted amidohydrolase